MAKTTLASFLVALVSLAVFTTSAHSQTPPRARPADAFFLQDGDIPVVFLGDSITEQKMYTTLIETYTLTRFPAWKITFRNVGWGGDTSWLAARQADFPTSLQRDVLSLQPKAITIDFGMNDARLGKDGYSKYTEYSTKLAETLKNTGARVALLTPSPEERYEIGQPAGSGYNVMLKKFSDSLKEVATKENVPFVDQFTPFVQLIEAGRKAGVLSNAIPTDPTMLRLTIDGVHPTWNGHLIMAASILQGLHAPALVSSASLDATMRSTVAEQGCMIVWQDASNDTVQFQRTDEALPWPTPPESDMALKIPGFDPATTLNRYELKMTGLKADSYKLIEDNKEIGTYSSTDLAAGVNLGFVRQGAIYDQGQKLLAAVLDKNETFAHRWHEVQIYKLPDWMKNISGVDDARNAELARLDKQIEEKEQIIDALRKPYPHIFKLEPVAK